AVNLVLIPRSKNAPHDDASTAAIDENRNESSQTESQGREMKARHPAANRESVPRAIDSDIELAQSSKNSRTARASNRRVDGRNRDRAGDSTSGRFYRSATTPPRRGRSVSISATLSAAAERISRRRVSTKQESGDPDRGAAVKSDPQAAGG